MRLARAFAAAALTLGLTATLAPVAQAAPTAEVAAVSAVHATRAAPAPHRAKLTAKVPRGKIKVGKTIKVTGRLTHKTTKGDQPLPGKNIVLILGMSQFASVLAEGKTTRSGTFTLRAKAEKWMVGKNEARVLYDDDGESSTRPVSFVLRVKK